MSGRIFLLASFCLLLEACDEDSSKKAAAGEFDLSLLVGRWEFQDNRTKIEEWTLSGENELSGKGFVLTESDTSFIEFLSIRKEGGVLTYFAGISGQESGEVVPFTLSFQSSNRIEFKNESLDFPKRIGYEILGNDKIESYIEGPLDGQTVRKIFDYEKRE